MRVLREIRSAGLHLLFPHLCAGCGNDWLPDEQSICIRCRALLPATGFAAIPDNPIEKKFWGRMPVARATAQYYFTRGSIMQHLLHDFKYKYNRALGLQLGHSMGKSMITQSFSGDVLIPLPLFSAREKRRGFNQSTILCTGMAASMHIPVLTDVVIRTIYTDTQTRKGRIDRWLNVDGKFLVKNPDAIRGKRVILVDDVITTGATLEACGNALLEAGILDLRIAALCYANR